MVYEKMVRCPLIFDEAFFLSGGVVDLCLCLGVGGVGGGGDVQSGAVSRRHLQQERLCSIFVVMHNTVFLD